MDFLKKLSNLFSPAASKKQAGGYWVAVRCHRCGEVIRTRVNLSNDLSPNFGDGGEKVTYFCRKTLIGDQRCFQQVGVELTFDANRQLIDRQIRGGDFIDADE
jgi:hypothetical protein